MESSAIQRACAAVGGQSALARELSRVGAPCSPQAVQKMCSNGRVPAERVIAVERISGVPRHELRPDLYPTEQAAA